MKSLILMPLSLVALVVFTGAAMDHLPAILEPVFALANGDPDRLAWVFGLAVIATLVATWIWSARSRR